MGKRSNGEGTIFKRKDGRWCAAYFDENYKRHFVYGKTQTEVKKKLKMKQSMSPVRSEKPLLMQDWVKEYLVKYKRNELKVTTYSSYIIMKKSKRVIAVRPYGR